jgi:hypothetical protein
MGKLNAYQKRQILISFSIQTLSHTLINNSLFYVPYLRENLITCFITFAPLHKNTIKSENDVIAGRKLENSFMYFSLKF